MNKISTIFGIAFGLVFIIGGIKIAQQTIVPAYQSWQVMKSWQPTTAYLLSLNGSDNSVEAQYGFSISNLEYLSNRVYIASFNDNFGNYHQTLYQRLKIAIDNNIPIDIWYNPDNPDEAVIDREMRWSLFALITGFISAFILSGFAIIFNMLRSSSARKNGISTLNESTNVWQREREENFISSSTQNNVGALGSQPWLRRDEWKNNQIEIGSQKNVRVIWIFASIWMAACFPLILRVNEEFNKGNLGVLLALIFPMIGGVLFKTAWGKTQQWRKQGDATLEMAPFPGGIGGQVGGSLILKNNSDFNTAYTVEVQCVERYSLGNGKLRTQRERIKWSKSSLAKNEVTAEGLRLRFEVDVPEGLPESDVERRREYCFWRVCVSSNKAYDSSKLKMEYIIPVFKKQGSETSNHPNVNANTALEYNSGEREQILYHPMFRKKALVLFSLFFSVIFSFSVYSMYQNSDIASSKNIGLMIFSISFALVALLAFFLTIYLVFNNLTVTIIGRQLEVVRRLLFFPIKIDLIQGGDIAHLEIRATKITRYGRKAGEYCKLIAHTSNNKKMLIAEDIKGVELANQLKEFISQRLLLNMP